MGLGRWMLAGAVGLVVGGFPVAVDWKYCGDIDRFDRIIFAALVILGVGYAQLALAASFCTTARGGQSFDGPPGRRPPLLVLCPDPPGRSIALMLTAGVQVVMLFAMPGLM